MSGPAAAAVFGDELAPDGAGCCCSTVDVDDEGGVEAAALLGMEGHDGDVVGKACLGDFCVKLGW